MILRSYAPDYSQLDDVEQAVVDTDRVVASVARRVGGNSAFLADIDTNAASWCQ